MTDFFPKACKEESSLKIKSEFKFFTAIIIAYIIFRIAGAIKTPDAWYEFNPDGYHFSIRMASMPEKESVILPLAKNNDITLNFGKVNFLTTSYIIGYALIPAESRKDSDEEILRHNFSSLKKEGYSLVSENTESFYGFPSVYSVWASPDGAYEMFCRNVLSDMYLYRIVTATPKNQVENEKKHINHFFDSFKIN